MAHTAVFLLVYRCNQVSKVTLVIVWCRLSWVYERAAGKFFFLRLSFQGYSWWHWRRRWTSEWAFQSFKSSTSLIREVYKANIFYILSNLIKLPVSPSVWPCRLHLWSFLRSYFCCLYYYCFKKNMKKATLRVIYHSHIKLSFQVFVRCLGAAAANWFSSSRKILCSLQEAYFRYMAENPTAGLTQEEEEDNIDYDSDGNPIASTTKKIIMPLPPIDHSEVEFTNRLSAQSLRVVTTTN